MTKHIADHRAPSDIPRRKHFWAMERRQDNAPPHPAVLALSQRPKDRKDTPRIKQYLRIERGQLA